ncbi:MAG: hypothetical protein ACUVWY_10385 [Desulfosoma sp.]|uniref:hypothetical protein n=1 Tax=Desulfosoma sp. TaxID=2603217 RepID=UPI00404B8EC8
MRLDSVGGGDESCFNDSAWDSTTIQQVVQCMQNCGTTPECLLACLPEDLELTCHLAVAFLNESTETLEFKLPPTVFPHTVLPHTFRRPLGGSVYTPAAITGVQCLYEIAELTYGKTLSGKAQGKLQDMIWDCSETGTLSEEQRAYPQGLP